MNRLLCLFWFLVPLAVFGQGVAVRSQNGLATNLTMRTGSLIGVDAHGATNLWWLTNVFTINSATSRVDWSQLKGVPAAFADGTDDGAGAATAFTNTVIAYGDQYRTNYLSIGTTGTTNIGPLYADGVGTFTGYNYFSNGLTAFRFSAGYEPVHYGIGSINTNSIFAYSGAIYQRGGANGHVWQNSAGNENLMTLSDAGVLTPKFLSVSNISGSVAFAAGVGSSIQQSYAAVPDKYYNTWFELSYGTNLTSSNIIAVALTWKTNGLLAAGYDLIQVDDGWATSSLDGQGLYQVDTTYIPNITNLITAVHTNGFRFGIYVAGFGAPTIGNNTPAIGDPADIYAQAEVFANWGVDNIKLDYVGGANETQPALAKLWSDAIARTGRKMTLLMTDEAWSASALFGQFDYYQEDYSFHPYVNWLENATGPGYTYPAAYTNLHNYATNVLYQRLPYAFKSPGFAFEIAIFSTDMATNQTKNHLIWDALFQAPLQLHQTVQFATNILYFTNANVLSILNDEAWNVPTMEWTTDGAQSIWTKKLGFSGLTNAVAIWPWTNNTATVSLSAAQAGFPVGTLFYLKDVWSGTITGPHSGSASLTVGVQNPHFYIASGTASSSINPTNIQSGYWSGGSIGGNAASATTATEATTLTTALSLAKGGTAAALVDPGAHRLFGWNENSNATKFVTMGTGLSFDPATSILTSTATPSGGTNIVNDGNNVYVTDPLGLTRVQLQNSGAGGNTNFFIKYWDGGNAIQINDDAVGSGYPLTISSHDGLKYIQVADTGMVIEGDASFTGGTTTFSSLSIGSATFTNAVFNSNQPPATISPGNGFVVFNENNTSPPKAVYYNNGGTPTVTNTFALSGRSPTNTWGGAVVDFTRGEQVHTNMAGDLTITGIVGFVDDKDNWQVVDLNPNGADRVVTVPAAWRVTGFTNATTVTITNGTWAELRVSAIINRRTNAVMTTYY